jgi:catechol 2,3-dioxygenase-like lactoylglutathione lyase family enzyme
MKWISNIIGGKELIKGLDHIAIIVSDMDRGIEFYRSILGLKLIRDGRPEGGLKKTFMGSGNRVIIALTEDRERRRLKSGYVGGVNHVAFNVDDIEKASGLLKERGVEFIEEKIGKEGKVTAYHFLDPDGLELEICAETSKDTPQY